MGHHAAMTKLRRREVLWAAVLAGLLAASLAALALGADGLSLVLGASVVAVAFMAVRAGGLAGGGRDGRRAADRRAQAERRGHQRLAREVRKQGRQTIAAVEAAEARLYRQLEALDWLRAELELVHPLSPARGWAAAPDALAELVRLIDRTAPEEVVELGSGVSTIVIARRLQQLGRGRLVALDHKPEFAAQTRSELARHGLAEVASVLEAPLVDVRLGDETWSWYTLGEGVPARIDALFVDGPPGTTGPLARYPALPLLRERLVPGATIFLDDGDRPDEQEAVRRWQVDVEGLQAVHVPLAKGAWLLTMPGG